MAVIKLENIVFTYPDAARPAVDNLSFEVEKGQFIVLFGSSGSGKSTLLRLLKKEIQPHGNLEGRILLNGLSDQAEDGSSGSVGFVFQDPENQVVADDVLHELIFGLENIGLKTNEIRSRLAEMAHYFGAEILLRRKTHELSGGKKQQVNLASVLLMQPEVLLLDEPTAQLDPVSAREFLDMLIRLNEEFGMTIILAEHRLEEVFTLADKIIMLERGRIIHEGPPRKVLRELWETPYKKYVPSIPSLFLKMGGTENLPLTVKEGRSWLQNYSVQEKAPQAAPKKAEAIMDVKNLSFYYDKKNEMVLNELDFTLLKGEVYALLGGNGSGKSTLLKLLANVLKPQHGKIGLEGRAFKSLKAADIIKRIGYLPQNPKLFFIQDTVEKEIQATIKQWGASAGEASELLQRLGISQLQDAHPHDLSGGELQKAAIACLLLRKPDILLLDEPTKGLDPISKENLASILLELNRENITILMSTHDLEFAARYATRCGMMFQGKITSEESPENFFNGNFFYTTMIQRLFRHIPDNRILTVEEAALLCTSAEG